MSDAPNEFNEKRRLKLERLELALRASNEGIWDWNPHEEKIFYSRRILEFLECGSDYVPNLFIPPFEHVFAGDQQAFSAAVSQAVQEGGPETLAIDARILTGGRNWRWLRIRGTVVRNRSGQAVRIAGSMIDISRRKAAEVQIEEERFLLRQLIDHVPLKIYFKDLESRFTMANQDIAAHLGCANASGLIGKHDKDFFSDEHWKSAEADEQRIIRTGEPVIDLLERETRYHGSQSWVITSKFPLRDRHGNIKGTFGVSSDVTKLVNAQQEAVDLALQLQKKNQAYEEELMLAREIQQALAGEGFPTVSTNRNYQLNFLARYIPISGLAGDFFEVLKINDDCYGLLICDVMGHGVRSALVVAMLRGLLEKQRFHALDPGLFLHGLNDGLAAILERAGTTMFATAFFGIIDLANGNFRYSSAGHPGPIVAGPAGVWQIANDRSQKGPGLGLFGGAYYPNNQIPLSEINRLLLFTDGVLEAENKNGEPFFENRLMEIIASHAAEPMDRMLDGVLASVLAFSEGNHFDDDVCLLGVDLTCGSQAP
jgi:sigma-B regulation protein RsbU (phosphoserine phosphatase)